MQDKHFLQKDTNIGLQQPETCAVTLAAGALCSHASDYQFHSLTSAAPENYLVLLQVSQRGEGRLGRTSPRTLTVMITFFSYIKLQNL